MLKKQAFFEPFKGMSVLIVDDNANTRQLITRLLQSFEVNDILAAADGSSGLRELLSFKPDLVITDWEMRPMDGLTFLKAIRHKVNGDVAKTPVIMLTGHAKAEIARGALEAGANHFLTKPIVPGKLHERIAAIRKAEPEYVLEGNYYFPAANLKLAGRTPQPPKVPAKEPAPAAKEKKEKDVWSL